jgi:hypothetical protein
VALRPYPTPLHSPIWWPGQQTPSGEADSKCLLLKSYRPVSNGDSQIGHIKKTLGWHSPLWLSNFDFRQSQRFVLHVARFVKIPESSNSGPRVTNSRLGHYCILPLPKNTVESRKSVKLVGATARPGYCRNLFLRKKIRQTRCRRTRHSQHLKYLATWLSNKRTTHKSSLSNSEDIKIFCRFEYACLSAALPSGLHGPCAGGLA